MDDYVRLLIMISICCCIVGFLMWLFLKWYKKTSIWIPLLCIGLLLVRFLYPYELPFTYSLYLTKGYPTLNRFFMLSITVGKIQFSIAHIIIGIWILGIIVSAFLLLYRYHRLRRDINLLPEAQDPTVLSQFDRILAE